MCVKKRKKKLEKLIRVAANTERRRKREKEREEVKGGKGEGRGRAGSCAGRVRRRTF